MSEACGHALAQILQIADPQQERKIFEQLHNCLETNDWNVGGYDLEALILSLDWSAELQKKNLDWLDENLDDWRMGQRATLMERMGASSAEVIAWWEEYRDRTCAYRPLLELYRKHDLPRAIEWVRRHRDQCENTWEKTDDTKKLMELLEQAGRQQEADDELRHLVLDLKCLEPSYLVKLKQITPSDAWKRMFSLLLMETRTPDARMGLYRFAGMYDRFCEELCRKPSFNSFLRYEKELREWDPERTKHLRIQLTPAGDHHRPPAHNRSSRFSLVLQNRPEGDSSMMRTSEYRFFQLESFAFATLVPVLFLPPHTVRSTLPLPEPIICMIFNRQVI